MASYLTHGAGEEFGGDRWGRSDHPQRSDSVNHCVSSGDGRTRYEKVGVFRDALGDGVSGTRSRHTEMSRLRAMYHF